MNGEIFSSKVFFAAAWRAAWTVSDESSVCALTSHMPAKKRQAARRMPFPREGFWGRIASGDGQMIPPPFLGARGDAGSLFKLAEACWMGGVSTTEMIAVPDRS